MPEENGNVFGRYRATEVVSEGGLAGLYRGVDGESGQKVLLKVVRPHIAENPQFRKVFHDLQVLNEHLVDHPNVGGLLDMGKARGCYYFVVEQVEGEPLSERMGKGPVPLAEWFEIVRQVAEGLRAAHRKQLLHSDLKPSDIFLTTDKRGALLVKVMFFDLALATSDSMISIFGEMMGTPKYLAPERIMGKGPDARSDIFSLGVIAYELLTGREPFESQTALGYLHANCHQIARPAVEVEPGVPREVSAAIDRMLARDPGARYQSCQSLLDDLDRCEQRITREHADAVPEGADSAFAFDRGQASDAFSWRRMLATALGVFIGASLVLGLFMLLSRGAARPKGTPELTATADDAQVKALVDVSAAKRLLEAGELAERARTAEEARQHYQAVLDKYPQSEEAKTARERLAKLRPAAAPSPPEPPKKPAALTREQEAERALASVAEAAKAEMAKGRFESALVLYKEVFGKFADTPVAKRSADQLGAVTAQWAEHLFAAGDYETSVAKWREVATLYVGSKWKAEADSRVPEILLHWAQQLAEAELFERAIQKCTEVTKEFVGSQAAETARDRIPETLLKWAARFAADGKYDEAVQKLREITVKYAGSKWDTAAAEKLPEVEYGYAKSLLAQGQCERAAQAYQGILDKHGNTPWAKKTEEDKPELLCRWGQTLAEAGDVEKAVEKYNELQKKYASSPWAKQRSKELRDLANELRLFKARYGEVTGPVTMAQMLFLQATELLEQGKEAEAGAKLDELTSRYPKSEWAKKASEDRAVLLYKQGHVLMGQGKVEAGVAKHAELMQKHPGTESAQKAEVEARARAKSPTGMAYVPPGEFIMGSEPDEILKELAKVYGPSSAAAAKQVFGFDDETPRRVEYVDGFYIDKCEVTNAEYKKFVDATNRPPPPSWSEGKIPEGKENHPVTHVTWYDASEYAQWAGKRLPTEAEWEKAARGTDGRLYPWGAEFDAAKCNTKEADMGAPTEVGKYASGQSPYGCLDMAGNVYEWTADWYKPYPKSSFTLANPGEKLKVLRSSSFRDERIFAHAANRFEYAPSKPLAVAGFRCAQTP